MSIIYILIPIAMLFVLIAFGVFFWAVKNDQFEDLERHSASILFDEDDVEPKREAIAGQGDNQLKQEQQADKSEKDI